MGKEARSSRLSVRMKPHERTDWDKRADAAGMTTDEAIYLAVQRAVDDGSFARPAPVCSKDRDALMSMRNDYGVFLVACDKLMTQAYNLPNEYHRAYLAAGLAEDRSLVSVVAEAIAAGVNTDELLTVFFERYLDAHPGYENWSIDKKALLWVATNRGDRTVQEEIDRGCALEAWRHFQRRQREGRHSASAPHAVSPRRGDGRAQQHAK